MSDRSAKARVAANEAVRADLEIAVYARHGSLRSLVRLLTTGWLEVSDPHRQSPILVVFLGLKPRLHCD